MRASGSASTCSLINFCTRKSGTVLAAEYYCVYGQTQSKCPVEGKIQQHAGPPLVRHAGGRVTALLLTSPSRPSQHRAACHPQW
jgi:hypothetical protein